MKYMHKIKHTKPLRLAVVAPMAFFTVLLTAISPLLAEPNSLMTEDNLNAQQQRMWLQSAHPLGGEENWLQQQHQRETELRNIAEKTSIMTLLLRMELLLQEGYHPEVLTLYHTLYEHEKSPDIGYRVMWLAQDHQAFATANDAANIWQNDHTSFDWRLGYMQWRQQLKNKQWDQALPTLLVQLKPLKDIERIAIFDWLSKALMSQDTALLPYAALIDQAAQAYDYLLEAPLTVALLSFVQAQKEALFVALDQTYAIERNTILDEQRHERIKAILGWMMIHQPLWMDEYFQSRQLRLSQSKIGKKNPWLEILVNRLVEKQQFIQAQEIARRIYDDYPDARRTWVMAYMVQKNHGSTAKMRQYCDQSINQVTGDEVSYMAWQCAQLFLTATMTTSHQEHHVQVKKYLDKVTAEAWLGKKYQMLLTMALAVKDVRAIKQVLRQIEHHKDCCQQKEMKNNILRAKLFLTVTGKTPTEQLQKLQKMINETMLATDRDPQWLSILYRYRGQAHVLRNDYAHAVDDYEIALLLDPQNPEIEAELGYTLLYMGSRQQQGLALIEKAYDQLPDDAMNKNRLGWGYFVTGKTQEARKVLQEAYQQDPKIVVVAIHFAHVLWQLNERDKALAVLQAAYRYHPKNKALKTLLKQYQAEMNALL